MISSKSTIIAGGRAKLAIFLICLVGGFESTLASRSCKNTVMKVLNKRCIDAEPRARRAADGANQKDILQSLLQSVAPVVIESFTKAMMDSLKGMFPAYSSAIENAARSKSESSAAAGKPVVSATGRKRRAPYLLNSLPSAMDDDLGLDLTIGEVEELYSDIFGKTRRQPSITPDAAKDFFFDIAAKCCRNEDTCLRETIIDCP